MKTLEAATIIDNFVAYTLLAVVILLLLALAYAMIKGTILTYIDNCQSACIHSQLAKEIQWTKRELTRTKAWKRPEDIAYLNHKLELLAAQASLNFNNSTGRYR